MLNNTCMFCFKEESCARQSCLASSLANIVGVTKWVWQELHFVIPTILEEEDWSGLFLLWSVCQGITLIDLSSSALGWFAGVMPCCQGVTYRHPYLHLNRKSSKIWSLSSKWNIEVHFRLLIVFWQNSCSFSTKKLRNFCFTSVYLTNFSFFFVKN